MVSCGGRYPCECLAPEYDCDVADDRYLRALEFSWDELRHAILAQGFELVREEWRHCTYTANVRSMMRTDYDCIFFTARKPAAEGKS